MKRSTFLIITLVAVGLGISTCTKDKNPIEPKETEPTLQTIATAEEVKQLIDDNAENSNFIILDVRTQSEYTDGHIEGAINQDMNASDFVTQINALDKSKTYLVYCRSGNRSTTAVGIMAENGFLDLINFGGEINDWNRAGYPLVKDLA
ncbi:rhodanese-like domain-containing protein [candidate division KSB1 bacterium]|nr:rhodanese-like domain-containing protein [candidate division KSB1 bacterium]